MIREPYMDAGDWDLTLAADTPKPVLDLIDVGTNPLIGWAQLCITEAQFPPGHAPIGALPSVAVYGGAYLRKQRNDDLTWELSGLGMLAYLGAEDDTEPCQTLLMDDTSGSASKTATQWAGLVVDGGTVVASPSRTFSSSLLRNGSITAPTSNPAQDYGISSSADATRVTRRAFMEWIVTSWSDFLYRVNPDRTVDWGPHDTIYEATPVFIDVSAGTDGSNPGLRASSVSSSIDLDDWANTVYAVPKDGLYRTPAQVTSPFYGPYGDALNMAIVVHTSFPASWAPARGVQIVASRSQVHRTVSITVDSDSITYLDAQTAAPVGRVKPGHDVWVFDPFHGLVGTVAHRHRGRHVFPLTVRVQSVEWPVTDSHGVFLRFFDGVDVHAVDLSPYVVPDSGGVSLEVGDPRRRQLTPRSPGITRL